MHWSGGSGSFLPSGRGRGEGDGRIRSVGIRARLARGPDEGRGPGTVCSISLSVATEPPFFSRVSWRLIVVTLLLQSTMAVASTEPATVLRKGVFAVSALLIHDIDGSLCPGNPLASGPGAGDFRTLGRRTGTALKRR